MIVHLKKETSPLLIEEFAESLQATTFVQGDTPILITPAAIKPESIPNKILPYVDESYAFSNDLQLGSRSYLNNTREVKFGQTTIGGNTGATRFIAGPCSVESEEQIDAAAKFVASLGIDMLRAGCFKPRTSPYSFQGLGQEGLELLDLMRSRYGLSIITEVRDATHFDQVAEVSDAVQVGAKSMYDHGILRACGKINKPVMIKRHFGATLQEFVQAAEFVLSGGNENVVLCERGIRSFENATRFTMDLCGIAWLKHHTNLPIIVDPSHAIGYAYGVADLTRAAAAMGIDGLIIESHPNPSTALSDAAQQLSFAQLADLRESLVPILAAIGRKLV